MHQPLLHRADLTQCVVERMAVENPRLRFAFVILRLEIDKDVRIDPFDALDLALQCDGVLSEIQRVGVMRCRRGSGGDDDRQDGYHKRTCHGSSSNGSGFHVRASRYGGQESRTLRTVRKPHYWFVTVDLRW